MMLNNIHGVDRASGRRPGAPVSCNTVLKVLYLTGLHQGSENVYLQAILYPDTGHTGNKYQRSHFLKLNNLYFSLLFLNFSF